MDPHPHPQRCPVANTLNVVGERWSLLIVRDLLLGGPQRFQDFANSMEGISPSTLSKRLKSLEKDGIIERIVVDGRPPRTEYALTQKGESLRPVVRAMRRWWQANHPVDSP